MMKKLKELGFTAGHGHLLLVAFAIFAVIFVFKSGVNLKTVFVHADNEQAMLTFDDAKNQAANELGQVTEQSSDADEKQLALLDRSLDQGQVLGDSIGIGTIPNADSIFDREQLDQIKLTTVPTTPESLKQYKLDMLNVESQNDSTILLGSLNSDDPTVLANTKVQADSVIKKLSGIRVPSDLADYHRYKMIYYRTLSSMSDSFSKSDLNSDFENTTKIFFSINNKIQDTQNKILTKYGVQL